MFWDKVAKVYDLNETFFNSKVNRRLRWAVAAAIEPQDEVLECACGTGMLSIVIAKRCSRLTATDYSIKMLAEAKKKCSGIENIVFAPANILALRYPDNSFDKVVAGNVIHLLDDPKAALRELMRVCKTGGKVIVPTYLLGDLTGRNRLVVGVFIRMGAAFKSRFTAESYQAFFRKAGYKATCTVIEGNIPCAVAVLTK